MGLLLNEASLPPGGAPGTVLTKVGSADYEASWIAVKPAEGGGTVGPAGPQGPPGPAVETNEGFY